MHIHFGSLSSFLQDGMQEWFDPRRKLHLLGSLANDRAVIPEIISGVHPCVETVIIDSGAFSVRNSGRSVTLESYANQIMELSPLIKVPTTFVALDVIGDPQASQENYRRMMIEFGFGTEMMPVFHYGEDMRYLEWMVKEGYDYIGLGGVGTGDRLGQEQLRDWVKTVMFVNADGRTLRYPHVKWHGLAMTAEETLQMFPFYSVDSITWIRNSMLGRLLTPIGVFRASDDERAGSDAANIKRLPEITLKRLRAWLDSIEVNLDDCSDTTAKGRFQRHIVNINYYLNIQDNHNWQPNVVEDVNIFSILDSMGVSTKTEKKKAPIFKSFGVAHVNILENQQQAILDIPKKLAENLLTNTNLESVAKNVDINNETKVTPAVTLRPIFSSLQHTKQVRKPQGESRQVVASQEIKPLAPIINTKKDEQITPTAMPEFKESKVSTMATVCCPHCNRISIAEVVVSLIRLPKQI